uniref:GPI inositol-deacylase PGAP1-like alpha/beta domain-containing protein n=1 Tax=Opuntia streptacantha TaxID=393608 RepID=A0A7C9D7J2_OPUST
MATPPFQIAMPRINGVQQLPKTLQQLEAFKAQLGIQRAEKQARAEEEQAQFKAKTNEICTRLKALLMELANLARDEEEELWQLNCGVENPPSVDALQVFEESPKGDIHISLDDGFGEGQGKGPGGFEVVPCEQFGGLNPSNELLEKSTSSIHGKVTSNAQGKQQVYDMEHPFVFPLGFPEPHEGWKEINCDGHIKQLSGVPVLFRPGKGGSYKQGGLELDSAKLSMPKRYISMLNWFAVNLEGEHSAMDGQILKEQQRNHGWSEANGFCVFVFDPGKLMSLVLMYGWLVAFTLAVVRLVFDPGGKIVSSGHSTKEAGKEGLQGWGLPPCAMVQQTYGTSYLGAVYYTDIDAGFPSFSFGSLRTSFLKGEAFDRGKMQLLMNHVRRTGSFNEAVRGLLEGGVRVVRIVKAGGRFLSSASFLRAVARALQGMDE